VQSGFVHLRRGLALIASGAWFEAHEELELAWRAAAPAERDFHQGLVHVAVAWYQAGRGNRVGCERQLEKARRRLGPYAPQHEGVDVAALLAQVDAAAARVAAGSLDLDPVDPECFEGAVEGDVQPPVAAEEEQ
jgi:predicted metal-dependent hydrolase